MSRFEFIDSLRLKGFDSYPDIPDLYICFKGDYRFDVEVNYDCFSLTVYNDVTGDIVIFVNNLPFGVTFI